MTDGEPIESLLKVGFLTEHVAVIDVYCPFCGTKMDTTGAHRRDPAGVNIVRDYNCLSCGFMAVFLETVHRGYMEGHKPAVNEDKGQGISL